MPKFKQQHGVVYVGGGGGGGVSVASHTVSQPLNLDAYNRNAINLYRDTLKENVLRDNKVWANLGRTLPKTKVKQLKNAKNGKPSYRQRQKRARALKVARKRQS